MCPPVAKKRTRRMPVGASPRAVQSHDRRAGSDARGGLSYDRQEQSMCECRDRSRHTLLQLLRLFAPPSRSQTLMPELPPLHVCEVRSGILEADQMAAQRDVERCASSIAPGVVGQDDLSNG